MLSIFLTKELERIAERSQDTLHVQYFCDNKDEKRNTAAAIIRGLIFQLLSLGPKLFDYILPSFKTRKESLFTSFEVVWMIFENMVHDPVLGTVYGLDECDEASLKVLLKNSKALSSTGFAESSTCHLNLIGANRDFPVFISDVLSSFPRMWLDRDADRKVNSDINLLIKAKVDKLRDVAEIESE